MSKTTDSQRARIKAHLEAGNGVSQWTAIQKWKCLRLSGRIRELRKQGMNINTTMVEHDGKRYGVYTLDEKFLGIFKIS